ncbi:MAG: hypothetical protein ACON5K_11480, partial [Bacteroidia bacterium]
AIASIGYSYSQKIVKLQTNIGSAFQSFNYTDASGNSLSYSTQANSDLRIGLMYKSDTQSKIGLGLYAGILNISSQSTEPISSINMSAFNFDFFFNYYIGNEILQSLSIGPTWGIVISQDQSNDNQAVKDDGFATVHAGLYTELLFGGLKTDKASANPYLFYRTTLSNVEGADADTETSGYSSIGLGLKISI